MKTKIGYVVAVCMIMLLLWLGNEGSSPLVYTGTRLQHSVGLIDSENNLVIRDSVAVNGIVASTPGYIMNKGTYTTQLNYTVAEEGSVLELWEQGRKVAAWSMDPSRNQLVVDFTLSKDAKQLQLQVNYSGKGDLTIKSLSLSPAVMFYSDSYFMMAVFLLCSVLVWKIYIEGNVRLTQEQLVDYSIILGVALLAMTPMMQTYLYNGDDLCYHLARLEGLKDGILDGQIPVNIQPDGMRENGYLNALYPYLFLYIGAFLRICRVSIGLSYKTLVFLANLASASCAYIAVKSMSRSRRSVILAVVLYTLMPYRFTNIFSRGDLGETLALIFWPLVIAGLYHIIMGDRKKWYYLVIGFGGAFQSHILSAAFVSVFCVITALIWCRRIMQEKRYLEIGKAAGVTLLLNMWYLVPFLYYYFGERLNTDILRWSGYFEQSINPSNLTQSFSPYNKQYFSLGLALLGCVGIGVIRFVCERDREKTDKDGYLLYLLVLGCLLTYMITGYFPSKALLENEFFENIYTMLQFPWRFLGPASACFVFVGTIGLSESQILKPHRNTIFALLIGLNLLVILSVPTDNSHMPYENAEAVASKGHETKFAANIGLFYPHEWRIEGASDDKLTSSVVVSDPNGVSVSQYQKKGTKAAVVYIADEAGYIELPIQGYLGYRAYDETGRRLEIEEGIGGRMRFSVSGDGKEHTINVRYGPVPAFIVADLVSALTIVYIVWKKYKKKGGGQEVSSQAI
ncbi:MAG: 6-pyruvoyl-tetrahydropterin synthase-related protein [Eubacterium sp.]|nr:6-pyruvoyl-tetrahydropterin synthase-related protein [Eubacterium sp.]